MKMKRQRMNNKEKKAMIMKTRNLSNNLRWLMRMRRNQPMKGKTKNTIKMRMMESMMKLSFKKKIGCRKKIQIVKMAMLMRLMLNFKKRTTMDRMKKMHLKLYKKKKRLK